MVFGRRNSDGAMKGAKTDGLNDSTRQQRTAMLNRRAEKQPNTPEGRAMAAALQRAARRN